MTFEPLTVVAEKKLIVFTNAHKTMKYVEVEMNENCDLNLSVIKQVIKLACEQYLIARYCQIGKFYLNTGSVIEKY